VTGQVTEEAAKATGLAAGTPVAGGGGDQAASAVGNGIVVPGLVSCTIGTSGVVFAHLERPVYDQNGRVHTFCHAVSGKWHVMGVTQGAGLSLQWFRDNFSPGTGYDELTAEAAKASCCAQGLFWLPYLMGERTPHLDATARGGWIGVTARHTRGDLLRALIEGVSFSLRDCLDIVEPMSEHIETVRVSGGGGKSIFWRQLLADIFAKKVATLATQEGSAYGAAIIAMAATGQFGSVPEACQALIHESSSVSPRPHESQLYSRAHEVYRALYPTLKPIYSLIQNM
jgi:xylulokinase